MQNQDIHKIALAQKMGLSYWSYYFEDDIFRCESKDYILSDFSGKAIGELSGILSGDSFILLMEAIRIAKAGVEAVGGQIELKNHLGFQQLLSFDANTIFQSDGSPVALCGVFYDISNRIETEKRYLKVNALLSTLKNIQSEFFIDSSPFETFDKLLQKLLEVTQSEYGFIGEVFYDADEKPFLKTFAITNIAWNEETLAFYKENAPKGLEFRNLDSLFGHVMTSKSAVIANDPGNDPRKAGLPKGHPKMDCFLGVPLLQTDSLLGMFGVANKPGGYSQEDVDFLAPLMSTCTSLLKAVRVERSRKAAVEELVKAKEAAEQAAKAKMDFLSMMSHEIRTPLNAIMGMSNLMSSDPSFPIAEQEKLHVIKFSSENLMSIINDILDLTKIESGKIHIEETSFNLLETLNSLKKGLQFMADKSGSTIKIIWDSELPAIVVGDKSRLVQVFNNLLSNAVKFTEGGKISLFAELISQTPETIEVLFSVVDTGIGIAPSKMEYIFEAFTQASSDTNRRFGGTGLGLPITKHLLALMGSEIKLESQEGKGSKFYFSILLKKDKGQEASVRPNLEDGQILADSLKNSVILVVEDQKINQFVVGQYLKQWGCAYEFADSGAAGIAAAKQKDYQVILMDLQMPDIDGFEAARVIHALPNHKETPIIAFSASVLEDTKSQAAAAGMFAHVSKPFVPEDLKQMLIKALQNKLALQVESKIELKEVQKPNFRDLGNKINEIFSNDKEAISDFSSLCIEALSDFKKLLEEISPDKYEAMRFSHHSLRPTLLMLGLEQLNNDIEQVKIKIKNGSLPEKMELLALQTVLDEVILEINGI